MTEPDYIESSYSNGAVVIRFKSGVYFDFMKLQATTDYLIALVNHKNCSHMIIDMDTIESLSSQLLNCLVSVKQGILADKKRLKLCCLHSHPLEILRVTHLERQFELYKDLKSALESCKPVR